MKPVVEYTSVRFVKKVKARNKFKAIEELAQVFEGADVCGDARELVQALKEREQIMSTGIGFGIAIPHARINSVREMVFAVGISKKGIDFDSIDSKPVNLIILVAAGERQHKEYLKLLSSIMAVLKKAGVKDRIINASSSPEILSILTEQ